MFVRREAVGSRLRAISRSDIGRVLAETVPSILVLVARGSCILRSNGPFGPEDPFQSARSSDRFPLTVGFASRSGDTCLQLRDVGKDKPATRDFLRAEYVQNAGAESR